MASNPIISLERLIRVRRVRMEQAKTRLADAERRTSDAERLVAETRELLQEYALTKLVPGSPRHQVDTQHRFAGKVNELLQNRAQQAERVAADRERRRQLLGAARTGLLIAEKLTETRIAQRERELARKLRRRSIHRPNGSGTLHHPAVKD